MDRTWENLVITVTQSNGIELRTSQSENEIQLLIVDDQSLGKKAGGVQLLARALATAAEALGLRTHLCTTEQVQDILDDSPDLTSIVYLQRGGSLSADYRKRALGWLGSGAHIFEKNVFARASRFRPIHANYHLAVMSHDGAFRYSIRSSSTLTRKQQKLHHLPNPVLMSIEKRDTGDGVGDKPDSLKFLRIGRPDPIKWSEFEVDFCRKLSVQSDHPITLTRIGHPTASGTQTFRNFTIIDLPYVKNPAAFYKDADVYLHYSKIGETYGNTVAEAVRVGTNVALAVDLSWDCASIEFLSRPVDVVGHATKMLNDPKKFFDRLDQTRGNNPNLPPSVSLSPEEFISVLVQSVTQNSGHTVIPVPSYFDGALYIFGLHRDLGGSKATALWGTFRVLIKEAVRAAIHSRLEEK
jgi:hypothetical protein